MLDIGEPLQTYKQTEGDQSHCEEHQKACKYRTKRPVSTKKLTRAELPTSAELLASLSKRLEPPYKGRMSKQEMEPKSEKNSTEERQVCNEPIGQSRRTTR